MSTELVHVRQCGARILAQASFMFPRLLEKSSLNIITWSPSLLVYFFVGLSVSFRFFSYLFFFVLLG